MFHSPFSLFLRISILISSSSCFSLSSRSAVKSSGGGKVPERKGKQRDTLYLAFNALPCINGSKKAFNKHLTFYQAHVKR